MSCISLFQTWGLWEEGRSHELVDPTIGSNCTVNELEQAATCIQVALLCVQECPNQRPPMADVIPMLLQQKTLSQPRRPVVCTPMSHRDPAAVLGVQEITSGNSNLTITNPEGR